MMFYLPLNLSVATLSEGVRNTILETGLEFDLGANLGKRIGYHVLAVTY